MGKENGKRNLNILYYRDNMIEMVTFIRLIERCRFDTCCLFKILFIVSVLQFLVHMID